LGKREKINNNDKCLDTVSVASSQWHKILSDTTFNPKQRINMKIRGLISVTLFLVALGLLTEAVADNGFSARLISPTAGQILHSGQTVRVEWEAHLPKTQAVGCEMELLLSLDGGASWYAYITPPLDPKTRYFDWTVPNTPPTSAAVLDIRFGCEVFYPESRSPQTASPFVIMQTAGQ
jgi:hypothetical protein